MRGPCVIRTVFFLLAAVVFVGCAPDFDEPWLVKDLRILAVRAAPPEILLADPSDTTALPAVTIDALVVDPRGKNTDLIDWELSVCTAEEEDCTEAAYREPLIKKRTTRTQISHAFVLSSKMYQAALAADPYRGFGGVPVLVELRLVAKVEPTPVIAIKRVVYGALVPATKVANRNPILFDVAIEPTKTSGLVLIDPKAASDAKETYDVLTFSTGTKTMQEYLSYSFFVTAGKLSHAKTGGKPSPFVENKKVTDTTVQWIAPDGDRATQLWVVLRDDRGGVDFRTAELPAVSKSGVK